MATSNFTLTYNAGSTVRLAVIRLSDGKVLDFSDNTFKTLASATTPYSNGTELTASGGAGKSGYYVALNLSHLNSTSTPADFLVEWFTDTALDLCISETMQITVTSSLLDGAPALTRAELDANSTQLSAIKTVTDHIATGMELDSGNYRFTVAALANAPSGGGGGLDAAGVRSAIGLASANLDTQLGTIYGKIDTEVAAIQAKTDLIGTAGVLADGGITTAKFATGAIDASVIATDAFGALELAAGAASEIATAVATALGIGGTIAELTGPIDTSAANLGELVMSLAMIHNNKVESDRDGNLTVYNAAGSAVWMQAATTDGTTITKDKAEAP